MAAIGARAATGGACAAVCGVRAEVEDGEQQGRRRAADGGRRVWYRRVRPSRRHFFPAAARSWSPLRAAAPRATPAAMPPAAPPLSACPAAAPLAPRRRRRAPPRGASAAPALPPRASAAPPPPPPAASSSSTSAASRARRAGRSWEALRDVARAGMWDTLGVNGPSCVAIRGPLDSADLATLEALYTQARAGAAC
jgi:hypothetical protein